MGRKQRSASDMLAECVIEMVHEYKGTIETRNRRIDYLNSELKECERMKIKAVEQANDMSDKLGEIADIIAGITEHTESGYIQIYLSDIQPKNESKLKRLFRLLDIPMTAEQIKEGDNNVED